MEPAKGRCGAAAHDDGGASLVELAIALPLLMILLLGMVSAGIAYNHNLALAHSAREAGRHAATLPVTNFGSMDLWLDEVAARAIEDATGSLNPGTPGLVVCVAYVHPNGSLSTDSTRSRTINGATVSYASTACFPDGRPDDERRVQVSVAREATFNALVFSTTVNLDSEATNRFEAGFGL
jgi:Flp pilus assembly protein TadG